MRGELLLGLDENALLGLGVLPQKSGARMGRDVVVQLDGLVMLNGQLGGLN